MHFTTLLSLFTILTPLLAAPTPSSTALTKRYSADDATDVKLVKEWMAAHQDPENPYVFYSDSSVGQAMARNFAEANEEEGYRWFYSIFGDDFTQDFGGADPSADEDIAKACSQAMGEFATGEVRVFNHAGAKEDSFWRTIELPALRANDQITAIFSMKDNTEDPDDHSAENLLDELSDDDFEPDDDDMDVDDSDDDDDSFLDDVVDGVGDVLDELNPLDDIFDKRR